jgi:hypothetical protein
VQLTQISLVSKLLSSCFCLKFIGQNAGYGATNANNSTFIGQNAGSNATGASQSTLIWFLGWYCVL